MTHYLLAFLLLLATATPSYAQQPCILPAGYAADHQKAARFDSLLTEHEDLKRFAVWQQHRTDTLKIDIATAKLSIEQLRRALFNEIDYNQSFELNHLIHQKERARLQRRQRRKNAVLARQYQRRQRDLRRK